MKTLLALFVLLPLCGFGAAELNPQGEPYLRFVVISDDGEVTYLPRLAPKENSL